MKYDIAIIGGGILGLATGMALRKCYPSARMAVLEKESAWATHQTGRNSGVIHSGIYYKPGSLKAKLAREGGRAMVEFCREHGISHEICGKVIVATRQKELSRLEDLYERGRANGVPVTKMRPEELKEIEPAVRGLSAIRVTETGIVDYLKVAETFAKLLSDSGTDMYLNARVCHIAQQSEGVTIDTTSASFQARFLVNCAGLHCDRMAALAGAASTVKIIPFRGEYYTLKPDKRHLVRNLVYPVPDPKFPFLGVHLTRMIGGEIHAGPNAVLSLKREGYDKWSCDAKDMTDVALYPGFWRLARRYWRVGISESFRSAAKEVFARDLRRLVPEIQASDLLPAESGVRAQAVARDGSLVDDFLIVSGPNAIHVCNAPSPAATASIEIGRHIARQVSERLG